MIYVSSLLRLLYADNRAGKTRFAQTDSALLSAYICTPLDAARSKAAQRLSQACCG
ncbi:MAG: hypothetical protein LIP08_02020 [Bacteroides sp.]|nr:hypothetical protein [Bacteroides sp.]